ncbi:MAG: diphthine--ammonia ligase [Halobacteriales archaeon]|nr:diphthine--ammonia ligase [Halobacteriales archaeon]
MSGNVAVLFSGGKDSSYALARADEEFGDGEDGGVDTLVSVKAREASLMYHVPTFELTSIVAESAGKEHVVYEEGDDATEPLREAVAELEPDVVAVGAVASEYQMSRVEGVCEEFGVDVYAPLWEANPEEALREVTDEFDVIVTAVAADGMDETWLGRELNDDAVEEILDLRDEYGVHPMGEGGEFETLVVAGSHMDGRLRVEYEKEWDGMRGSLRVTDAEIV